MRVIEQVLEERRNVADIHQGFTVRSRADHQESFGRDLLQQVEDIPPVILSEHDTGPNNHQFALFRSLLPLRLQHLFRLPLALAVMPERIHGI